MSLLSGMGSSGKLALLGPLGAGKKRDASLADAARAKADANSIFGLGSPEEAASLPYAGGYKNLMELINNPGQTDQALFNRSLANNDRFTQSQLGQSRMQFARSGQPAGPLGAAFQSAIASAGRNRRGAIVADDAQRRDALRRQDAQLLYQFIQKPRIDRYANDRGIQAAQNQLNQQTRGNEIAGASALIGSIAAAAKK